MLCHQLLWNNLFYISLHFMLCAQLRAGTAFVVGSVFHNRQMWILLPVLSVVLIEA